MAEIVEAQRPQPGRVARPLEATPERRAVERVAGLSGDDKIVGARPVLALTRAREHARDLIHQGDAAPEPRLWSTELARV